MFESVLIRYVDRPGRTCRDTGSRLGGEVTGGFPVPQLQQCRDHRAGDLFGEGGHMGCKTGVIKGVSEGLLEGVSTWVRGCIR